MMFKEEFKGLTLFFGSDIFWFRNRLATIWRLGTEE